MARRCRALDWTAVPLGPVAGWLAALRTAVRLVFGAPGAMSVHAVPAFATPDHDADRRVLGANPPAALGRPAAELAAMADAAAATASYRGPHAAAGRRMVGVLTDVRYHRAPHVVRLRAGPGLAASGIALPDAVPDLAGMEEALDRLPPWAPLQCESPAEATRTLFQATPSRP